MFNQKNKVTRADYEQWRAGQDETAGRIASDPDRLLFHVEPELGWLNDPQICSLRSMAFLPID